MRPSAVRAGATGKSHGFTDERQIHRQRLQPRIAALQLEIDRRLKVPSLQPPAWKHFLLRVYTQYPPQSMSEAHRTNELAKVRLMEGLTEAVPRALRQAVMHYHPDRNQSQRYGIAWAVISEEVSKIATSLLALYKQRLLAFTAKSGLPARCEPADTEMENL